MIRAEWKRLWQNKNVKRLSFFFIILAVLQNVFIALSSDVVQMQDYLKIVELADLSDPQSVEAAYTAVNYDLDVIEQVEYVRAFDQNHKEKMEEIRQKENSVIFSNADSQNRLKAEKKILQKLDGYQPELLNDLPFRKQLELQKYWSAVYLMIGMYLVYAVMQQDRESGVLPLYGSTEVSSKGTGIAKTAVILLIMILGWCFKECLDVGYLMLSHIPLHAPIQQITGYSHSYLYMTVLLYHVWMHGIKIITVFGMVMGFAVLCSMLNSVSLSVSVLTIAMIAEYVTAMFTSAGSSFRYLKTFNLFTSMSAEKMSDELFVFASFAVPETYIITAVSVILMIILTVTATVLYCRYFRKSSRSLKKRTIRNTALIRFQLHELLGTGKALLVVMIVLIYNLYGICSYRAVHNAREQSYLNFRTHYFGRINETLVERIEADRMEICSASEQMNAYFEEWYKDGQSLSDEQIEILNDLQNKAMNKENIERVCADVMELQEAGAEWYSDQETLELLMNRNNSFSAQLQVLMIAVPLIVIIFSVMSSMYQSGMYRLCFSSETGKKKYLGRQWCLFAMTALILMGIVYGSHAAKILLNHSYVFMNVPVNAVGIPSSITLSTWYLLLWLNRILAVTALIAVCMKLSERFDVTEGSALVILIIAALTISPVGIMNTLRYDYLRYPLIYAVMVLAELVVIFV